MSEILEGVPLPVVQARGDETSGLFTVESSTRRGLMHDVSVLEEDSTKRCTCEAGRHGVDCWHLDYCRAVYYITRYANKAAHWPERQARVARAAQTAQAARFHETDGYKGLMEAYG